MRETFQTPSKMRGVVGLLGKTVYDSTKGPDPASALVKHLNAAFAKPAADERLIFIDVNTDPDPDLRSGAIPKWVKKTEKRLEWYERRQLQEGQSAYVIITNMYFHRALQSDQPSQAILAHGLGNDFWLAGPRRVSEDTSSLFSDPSLYMNRELSWLEFNQRVLEEAQDPSSPLLERLKFLCIVASNLDEFFEVRVAGLKQQRESNVNEGGPDGMSPGEQLAAISARVRKMVDDKYSVWSKELVPALEQSSISFLSYDELTKEEKQYYTKYFEESVYPVLTPLAVDPFHPFPHLLNKSLNVAVELEGNDLNANLAVVQVPRILPHLLRYKAGDKGIYRYIFIGNLIQIHVGSLFHGVKVKGAYQFRVTRNSDLYLDEEETVNLLKTIEHELRNRSRGDAVRLEVQQDCPRHIADQLLQTFDLRSLSSRWADQLSAPDAGNI
jgi:hypothetical protein